MSVGVATLVLQAADSLGLALLAWWLIRTGRGNHKSQGGREP
jgi:hypothetical protein